MIGDAFIAKGVNSAAFAVLVVVGLGSNAHAQYREDTPPVVERTRPRPVQDPRPEIIRAFAKDYRAGGQPKIVLFWSVAFDDSLDVDTRRVTRKDTSETGSNNSLDKSTNGSAGNSTLREGDFTKKKVETTEERTIQSDASKRPMPFSPRDSAEMKQAFLAAMRQGGVHFVDRDTVIRTTGVSRNSKDIKTVETIAATSRAVFILEILPVMDDRAPTGAGFTVSLKNIKSGIETASSFVHAIPWMPPPPESRYVATNSGFELKSGLRQRPTMNDIGIALAIDAMRTIGPPLGLKQ